MAIERIYTDEYEFSSDSKISTPIMSPTTSSILSSNLSSMSLTSSDDVMYNAIGKSQRQALCRVSEGADIQLLRNLQPSASGGGELTREELNTSNPGDDDNDGVVEFNEGLDIYEKLPGEDMDLAEMEKLYQNMDVDLDKNITKTSELIKKILKDDKIFSKIKVKMIKFDESKDKIM